MPCPHNKITIVQRSQRQSAVAAAAYQSGEKLFCEYDQQVKHYPEKRGIVHNEILLPANAPPEYVDRNTLWNAAEAVEKQWNSQLARRWVLTIPREIPSDQYAVLVREFCQQQFVSKGMIVDFAIHDPHPPGHNPHAPVLLTMRAMDEHGKWLPKSRKVYDLDENGERMKLSSGRWKSHKEDTVDWNDQKYCEIWRHEWEVIQNRYLEANDRPERVDLRSYARQGLDIVPTVHEGAAVWQMEKRGIQTNIGNLNREIRAANSLMKSIRHLIQNLKGWITELGEKRKELLEQKAVEEATLLPNLLMKYMEIRKEERKSWTRAGQNRGTSQDLKAVSEALSYFQQKGLSTVEDLEAFLEASGKSAADYRNQMKPKEARSKVIDGILAARTDCKECKPVYEKYQKIFFKKTKEKFKQEHPEVARYEKAAAYLAKHAFTSVMAQNEVTNNELTYYVQFESATKAANAKRELQTQYQLPDESISENTGVMGMSGQSNSTAMQSIYGLAAILFVLVLLAGILMISGSMNSMIAQRTQFFGMLRCIGASHVQIIRFVRLEALNWCKIAVLIGVFFGTIISWIICATLHYGIGGEFSTTPVFQISPVGLISGVVVGVVTVFLAAQSPAKRAAKVSPISAVTGNIDNKVSANHAIKFNLGKIDNSLGLHHAIEKKKNWFLMTASFALTIMLFFSFSVILDFAKQLVPSQNVTSADIALSSYANKLDIERSLADEIKKIDGVANAYGSSYMENIPATSSRAGIDHINIVSYDDILLDYSKESIAQGALDTVYGDSNKVATVYNRNNSLRIGDTIQFAGEEVEITCTLSQGLFGDDLIIICSQETFDRIMGNTKYGLIEIQLDSNATEETIAEIRSLENDDIIITDQRESNKQNNATYLAVRIVCYGFLAIVGIISLFNIVNSISMSVSARMKQYGAMRAVGMDNRQLKRMISAEAYTYAISGLIVGCGIGLPLSRFLYNRLIAHYFGIEWSFPYPMVWNRCCLYLYICYCICLCPGKAHT